MKKLFACAFIALSMFTSCSSSDDSVNVTEEKLEKKWYFKDTKANGTTEVYEHLSCTKDYIEFLEDGTYSEYYVVACDPTVSEEDGGFWDLDGNTILISIDGDQVEAKVTSISATKLQLSVFADFDDDGDDETGKVTFTNM